MPDKLATYAQISSPIYEVMAIYKEQNMTVDIISTYTPKEGKMWEWRKCTTDTGNVSFVIFRRTTGNDVELEHEYTYWQNAHKYWKKVTDK
jgi:hypothetical protein